MPAMPETAPDNRAHKYYTVTDLPYIEGLDYNSKKIRDSLHVIQTHDASLGELALVEGLPGVLEVSAEDYTNAVYQGA